MLEHYERLHVIVRGRVQGVSFRYFAHQAASQLALTGWVRNLPDGGVEVTAEGPRNKLNQFLADLSQGPPQAHVQSTEPVWSQATGQHQQFEIRW